MLMELGVIFGFALLNRLRGTNLEYELIESNQPVYWWHKVLNEVFYSRVGSIFWMTALVSLYAASVGAIQSFMVLGVTINEYYALALFSVGILFGLLWWATPGWGKYFSATTGYEQRSVQIAWIDWVGDRLVPHPALRAAENPDYNWDKYSASVKFRNHLRGTIQMALRGSVYSMLLFILLEIWGTFVLGHATAVDLLFVGMLLQGPLYWFNRYFPYKTYWQAAAERWTGMLLGGLIVIAINWIA